MTTAVLVDSITRMSSTPRYVAPGQARHRICFVDGVETLVLPARRSWFALPFLGVWLTMWTFGGSMAIAELLRQFQPFLLVWLIGWAFGWIFAAGSILWQLAGREEIAVARGDLSLRLRAGPLGRTRHYRGGEVRNLRVRPQTFLERGNAGIAPFLSRFGTVQFDHGATTIGMAGGVDEAEATMIRDWLAKRLPYAAG